MTARDELGKRAPVLPRIEVRPSKFIEAVRLYRKNLLFRALMDLAIVGTIVLVVTNWSTITSRGIVRPAVSSAGSANPSPAQPIGYTPALVAPGQQAAERPGATVIEHIDFAFDDNAIRQAYLGNQPLIRTALDQLAAGAPRAAAATLRAGDTTDPVISYAQAVVTLRLPDADPVATQEYLRPAVAAAMPQAQIMLGELFYSMAEFTTRSSSYNFEMLDPDGNRIPATPARLIPEAVRLWQIASSLGSSEAQRLLGMAAARGLTGPANLIAALSIWQAAAARGDVVSQFECALLLTSGGPGIAIDVDQSIAYLRMAAAQDFMPALQALPLALTKPILDGDTIAAGEAMAALDRALTFDLSPAERAALEDLYGQFLMTTFPTAMRDPVAAVDHWIRAVELGSWGTALDVADAYRLGNGRRVDPGMAYAFYSLAAIDSTDPRIAEQLATLAETLTARERQEAEDYVANLRLRADTMLRAYDRENPAGQTFPSPALGFRP